MAAGVRRLWQSYTVFLSLKKKLPYFATQVIQLKPICSSFPNIVLCCLPFASAVLCLHRKRRRHRHRHLFRHRQTLPGHLNLRDNIGGARFGGNST